jgi:hypothetical protein
VDQVVDHYRVPSLRQVPDALESFESPACQLSEAHAVRVRNDPVVGAVHHDDRAADEGAELLNAARLVVGCVVGGDKRLSVGVQSPADRVVPLLRRVRLRQALVHEELDESRIVVQPHVPVVQAPPALGVEAFVEAGIPVQPFG